MIKNFLFDLDEVVFDFATGFCEAYSLPLETANDAWKIDVNNNLTRNEFYKLLNELDHSFWSNLKCIPDGINLLEFVNSHVVRHNKINDLKKSIYFVSSPTYNPESWSGKKESVKTHFPKHSNNLILLHDKYLLANKETLLIDDKPSNIEKFIKAGGNGILFPMDHRHDPGSSFNFVKKEIMKLL